LAAAASAASAQAASAGFRAQSAAGPAFGIRRPLVGRRGDIAGHEVALPPALQHRSSGGAAAVALPLALLASAGQAASRGDGVLVELPAAALGHPAVVAAVPPGAWLVVDTPGAVPADAAAALRARGVKLGQVGGQPRQGPACDVVLLRAGGTPVDGVLLAAERWAEAAARVTLIATELPDLDAVERVLRGGVHVAGGHLARTAASAAKRELGSAAHQICVLLNHLALDRDTTVVVDAVRRDPALSVQLLRYAASPGVGLGRTVDSVDQAVALLGRKELQRWLSVQLLAAAERRQASRALQETALARGRLLELVARERGEADAGVHFTIGLLSMAEPLLHVPAADAIEPLRLPEAARQALLARSGPLASGLALLDAADADDGARLDRVVAALGLPAERLDALSDAAWAWARAAV
jgi:EAL and modified HD-GYP domain-containing signal transduction protein